MKLKIKMNEKIKSLTFWYQNDRKLFWSFFNFSFVISLILIFLYFNHASQRRCDHCINIWMIVTNFYCLFLGIVNKRLISLNHRNSFLWRSIHSNWERDFIWNQTQIFTSLLQLLKQLFFLENSERSVMNLFFVIF